MRKHYPFFIFFLISSFSFAQGKWTGNAKTWRYDLNGPRTVYPEKMSGEGWISNISSTHPRLFINSGMLPHFKTYVLNNQQTSFNSLVREVDLLPNDAPVLFKTTMVNQLPSGEWVPKDKSSAGISYFVYNGGAEAVKAALAYVVKGDVKYLSKAKAYLRLFNDVLLWTAKNELKMEHTGYSRINAFVAYDWISSALTQKEKQDLLGPMLDYTKKAQRNGEFKFKRTFGGPIDGNYGEESLTWYAGLAAYGEGVDNVLAEKFLKEGAELFVAMLNYREATSAGTGLLSAATVTYSFGDYPHSTFNFMNTWKSAFNEDLSTKWTQMLAYPTWFDWAKIKLVNGKMLYHGIGDLAHADNLFSIPEVYAHCAQISHIYAQSAPSKVPYIYSLMNELSAAGARESIGGSKFPFLPYILTEFDESKVNGSQKKTALPYFYSPNYGLLLMRSGERSNDTYASFRFGATIGNHQHYDELSFIIYKNNFLAIDAGSRITTAHHHNFAAQSVAHNTILIHQPEEPMPYFWKPTGFQDDGHTYYNHGGQNVKDKAKALALISQDDFIYAVGDATKSYSAQKSKEVVRQFLYLKPNLFVIYDRVVSVNPDQKKEFVLHFQNEPFLSSSSKEWGSVNGGELMVKTILPVNPVFNVVGGVGREFEASGRNWELPGGDTWDASMKLTGKWRVEVSDTDQRERTNFLHVLQTNYTSSKELVKTTFVQTASNNDILTLSEANGTIWVLTYNRASNVGLTIEKRDKDKQIYKRELTNTVETLN
ncbi:heparinase II/III domain-containing protein [Pedobacter arcticus]|uniref:heparinase II/III domain-containing protein n=1 Tax=Pedobacter arcticus TaxID=752140 RepID=UPI0002D4B139|nr:heparinase II/III family protein [Pedobacter arcticus]